MPVEVVLGLDVGTQSSKLVAVGRDGTIHAEERIAHTVSRPKPGQFEQDAEGVWWHDARALGGRVAARVDLRPLALGVSAIGPTALPTDAAGTPLRPGILYGIDTRAQREVSELTKTFGGAEAVAICGSAISSQSPVPKLLWLKRHEPDAFAAMRRWFTAHAWLVHKLSDAYAVDHHAASQCPPLYDVAAARWRDDVWAALLPGVEAPALVWPGETVGGLTSEASAATGLPAGMPVVMGTIDAWAEAYSAWAESPGAGMIMYGSTWFFIANSTRFAPSDRFWGTRSVTRDTFSLAGGMATGGLVLDWLARLFATDVKSILDRAFASPAAPAALLALPYLAGERTPFSDPDVRGVLFGLDLDTDADAVCRAAILGVALAARDNLRALLAETGETEFVAVGGGAGSPPLLQFVSDVTGVPQVVPKRTIGAALGDARLAAEAIGWPTPREAWNPPQARIHPADGASARFDAMFARFKELHNATRHLELPGGALPS